MPLQATYKIKNQWTWSMVGGASSPALGTGTASELNIEGLTRELDDERRPGAAGSVNYQGDFEAMTATITLTSITDSIRQAIFESVCSNVTLTVSAVAENLRDACDTGTYAITMRGVISKFPIGWQLGNDTAENEIIMGVNYYSDTWRGNVFIYDPDDFVWSWKGTNLWLARKNALGI